MTLLVHLLQYWLHPSIPILEIIVNNDHYQSIISVSLTIAKIKVVDPLLTQFQYYIIYQITNSKYEV